MVSILLETDTSFASTFEFLPNPFSHSVANFEHYHLRPSPSCGFVFLNFTINPYSLNVVWNFYDNRGVWVSIKYPGWNSTFCPKKTEALQLSHYLATSGTTIRALVHSQTPSFRCINSIFVADGYFTLGTRLADSIVSTPTPSNDDKKREQQKCKYEENKKKLHPNPVPINGNFPVTCNATLLSRVATFLRVGRWKGHKLNYERVVNSWTGRGCDVW